MRGDGVKDFLDNSGIGLDIFMFIVLLVFALMPWMGSFLVCMGYMDAKGLDDKLTFKSAWSNKMGILLMFIGFANVIIWTYFASISKTIN